VNPTDVTFRAGGRAAQLADRKPPYIPGMDAAGVVDKLGPDTSERLKPGDRVIMLVVPMGPHGGTYAEQLVASEASVVRAPKGTTDAEAATLSSWTSKPRWRRTRSPAVMPPGHV
jgi:NADPH2:quinone reductase